MSRYILKEYGSWGVMTISYVTGLLVSRGFSYKSLIGLAAISLAINSKQAFSIWIRSRGQARHVPALLFLAQAACAGLLLLVILGGSLTVLLPYSLVPLAYLILLRLAGEHALLTEITGFALLTLSTLIAGFISSGVADPGLYMATALFFIAGVIKVRIQFRKSAPVRLLMSGYLILAVLLYKAMSLPLMPLLPLVDNLIFSIFLYRVTLKTAGWVEVIKGILFMALMSVYYRQF